MKTERNLNCSEIYIFVRNAHMKAIHTKNTEQNKA